MALLIGFAPLVVFCIVARLSLNLALWIAFATSFSLGLKAFIETGILRLFDSAGMVLFGALAIYVGFIQPGMELSRVGLFLEIGLFGIAIWSLAKHKPFTLAYSGEQVSPEHWDKLAFIRVNYRLTWVWAAAFAFMAATDSETLFLHTVSPNKAAAMGLAALAGALIYTWQSGVQIGRRFDKAPF